MPRPEAKTDDDARRPRLLLIDHTRIGDGSATGELKAAVFKDWPAGSLAQLYKAPRERLGLSGAVGDKPFALDRDGRCPAHILRKIRAFNPDLILYRPTPMPGTVDLHALAMTLIYELGAPLAVWVMDDWPAFADASASPFFQAFSKDWRALVELSGMRLSIGAMMSAAFAERYGRDFEPVANGVDPSGWPPREAQPGGTFRLRYAGSLAENMTLASVARVAEAVERLAKDGLDIAFEINTREAWRERAAPLLANFPHTCFTGGDLTHTDYKAWLTEAGAGLIAYNFDAESIDYVRYSVANKLPECLASGAPILAHGPSGVATIRYLAEAGCALCATTPDVKELADAIRTLATDPALCARLGGAGRRLAFERHDIRAIRARFAGLMTQAAAAPRRTNPGAPRLQGAHIDETHAVAHLMKGARPGSIMVDVGAHRGSSLAPFDAMGWRVYAFEPDTANREALAARYGANARVRIDPRAVGAEPASGAAFYASQESTGISGLIPFHRSHEKTAEVDVTTIAQFAEDAALASIDFLKIDVEGGDLAVLKGVPWDQIRPGVIECEFEDAKTLPLGHGWRDIAAFLEARGYAVYLSEWHPIIRYGVRHAWRRLIKFPSDDPASHAWGNILAFTDDPGSDAVAAAFDALMTRDAKPYQDMRAQARSITLFAEEKGLEANNPSLARMDIPLSVSPEPRRPMVNEAAERLHEAAPRVYAMLRRVKRSVQGLMRLN